ncbi:MAG: acyl-CoA dehydrogenase family protein [Acidimicrobiia bacterium]|nr:acyl-CoA dehydrogenase family protein [Acidimicrobiia bacterium]
MTTTDGPATGTDADERRVLALLDELFESADPVDAVAFLGRQYDLGLAWVHFPEGFGGLGLSPKLQSVIGREVAARHGAFTPLESVIGMGMGAPTVVTHGSEAQKRRYLRPLFTGEEVWCQMFSEPGAGSDVAGLSTRAERDGDEWVVNGQKVWTSFAHVARWGMLVARTDPEAVKHKGMTYFVVDMHAPGVEVRPLRQMTGGAEFNEVYFTDVRIPDGERLSDVGDGWRVALTTLMNERVAIGGASAPKRGTGAIRFAVDAWQAADRSSPAERARREEVMRLWAEAEVMRLTNVRASQMRRVGTPGPEGSIGKLHMAEHNKALMASVMNLMGADGMLYGSYDAPPERAYSDARTYFLRVRANSIEGGTSEVMRNILGERSLGLPGDVRADKDLPWSKVPRN